MEKCIGCGKEIDPSWCAAINTGRKTVYICEDCRTKADCKVRDVKAEFYQKHSIKLSR